jgi:hypothetical protein
MSLTDEFRDLLCCTVTDAGVRSKTSQHCGTDTAMIFGETGSVDNHEFQSDVLKGFLFPQT